MSDRPIVLIHGYSDKGESFENWAKALRDRHREVVHITSYETLTNEVSIDDIAEGLDRALAIRAGLEADQEFDAVVHSTGMLVARSWLATYGRRKPRMRHLIGLAPATFGSPLAHKGRSRLGSIFKGNREFGSPDFLEAGDRILDALELGSSFTWELTHRDLLGPTPVYDRTDESPYVFTFCGDRPYGGLYGFAARVANLDTDGTDGTVRWAGCSLDTLKIVLDLTRTPDDADNRMRILAPTAKLAPMIPIADRNHASLLKNPPDELVEMVDDALNVSTVDQFDAWKTKATVATTETYESMAKYQQFVIHVKDERDRPITDWNLDVHLNPPPRGDLPMKVDVHPYRGDMSYRCFHVAFKDFDGLPMDSLWLRLFLSSGSTLVGYSGYTDYSDETDQGRENQPGWWDGWLNISHLIRQAKYSFFWPFTTTFIEIRINREPLPLDRTLPNRVLQFLEGR